MHARKQAMFDRADAFIALPGGLGTLEELVEQMTWLKLGRHAKPVIVADIEGFWHPLLDLISHMDGCGFLGTAWAAPFQVCHSVDAILAALQSHPEARPEPGAFGQGSTPAAFLIESAERTGPSPSRHDVYTAR